MAETETIIGSTITVTGEFRSDEQVRVLGKISGRIETTADIVIDEEGTIEAEVTTRNLDVHGSIVGNVVASDWGFAFFREVVGHDAGPTRA